MTCTCEVSVSKFFRIVVILRWTLTGSTFNYCGDDPYHIDSHASLIHSLGDWTEVLTPSQET